MSTTIVARKFMNTDHGLLDVESLIQQWQAEGLSEAQILARMGDMEAESRWYDLAEEEGIAAAERYEEEGIPGGERLEASFKAAGDMVRMAQIVARDPNKYMRVYARAFQQAFDHEFTREK